MPGMVPPIVDEREGLFAYLDQQRTVLRIAAFGLTDDQARQTTTVGPLTVGGLIKHVASVEQHWVGMVLQQPRPASAEADYTDNFRLLDNETLDEVLTMYADVAKETEAAL